MNRATLELANKISKEIDEKIRQLNFWERKAEENLPTITFEFQSGSFKFTAEENVRPVIEGIQKRLREELKQAEAALEAL